MLTLNSEGAFQYYEGLLSSYIGLVRRGLDGDAVHFLMIKNMGDDFITHYIISSDRLGFKDSRDFLYNCR